MLEPSVIVAALATIPLTVAQERGETGPLILAADWLVWSVFAVEYFLLLHLAPERSDYVRRNWLSAAVVFFSFPPLPALFSLTRLLRLARLARLVRMARLVIVGARGLRAMRSTLRRKGLIYMAAVTATLVLVGGGLLAVLEPDNVDSVGSGIWWAVVTATTVGYGDVAPISATGRAIAVFLMLAGVGLFATLAAAVAARFVTEEEQGEQELSARLDRIESLLEQVVSDNEFEE